MSELDEGLNRHSNISMLLAVLEARVVLSLSPNCSCKSDQSCGLPRLGWGDVTCHRDRTEAPKISRIDPHREDATAVICAPGFDARGIVWRPHQLHIDLMLECCRSDC